MGGPSGGGIFGGLGDYLKSIFSGGSGSQAQPTATTPPAAGAATTAPADTSTTGAQFGNIPISKPGLFDSPWVQGALATYLGAIGSPRREGLGGAISHGGLAGLGAYQSAKEAQLKPYLIGAQIQHTQAQTKELGAKGEYETAHAKQLGGYADTNARTAAQLTNPAALAQMSPAQQDRAHTLANMIANDPSKAWDPDKMLKAVYGEVDEETKNQIEAHEAQQRGDIAQQKLPGELAIQQGTLQRDYAETKKALDDSSLTPDRRKELQERTEYLGQQLDVLKKSGGVKPKLTWLFDRNTGQAQQVLAGPGYTPPPNLTPIRPPNKVSTPQGIINQKKGMDAYTAKYGTWGAIFNPDAPTAEQFFHDDLKLDYDTGMPLGTAAPGAPAPQTGVQGQGTRAPGGAGGQIPPPPPPTGITIPSDVATKYQAKGYTISPDGGSVFDPNRGRWGRYDPNTPDED